MAEFQDNTNEDECEQMKTSKKGSQLHEARSFLRETELGQRIQAGEYILTLLVEDKLPQLKQFIFNSCFDIRTISDNQSFQNISSTSENIKQLFQDSLCRGYIKVHFESGMLRVTLFHSEEIDESESVLYARTFGEVIAVTYAALGLDMRGLVKINGDLFEKK